MSSLRNAVKRSTHKERAQPSSRHRFGLLEKKKDYLQRARNHQQKEQTLKILREKAENRNPDEYYPAMQRGSQRTANPDAGELTDAQIKALKSQDLLHVLLQSRKRQKDVEKLQASLHFIGAPVANQHTVFVDSPGAVQSFAAEQQPGSQPQPAAVSPGPEAKYAAPGTAMPDRAAARQARRRASAYQQLLQARKEAENTEQLAAQLRAAKVAASRGRRRAERANGGAGPVVTQRFKRVRQR